MRTHYRAIALAISIGVAGLASAQGRDAGPNPTARAPGGEVFFYAPLNRSDVFDKTGIGRPNPRNQHQVTPVPEPSQWAMMLAGLALVGVIVRRNSKR